MARVYVRGRYNLRVTDRVRPAGRRGSRTGAVAALLASTVAALACGADRGTEPAATERLARAPVEVAATPPAPPIPATRATASSTAVEPARERPVVVFLGDSLTAGLGLAEDDAWPAVVAERLSTDGLAIRAVNAGVSGDTSAGGLRRLAWQLRQHPDVVVVELGANDGLRGQPVDGVESNLREIVKRCQASGARVLLVGMRVPPSLSASYANAFAAIYPRLSRELGVPLVPFLLAGVAGDPDLNQADGLHPNVEGHRRVADVVLPHLESMLRDLHSGQDVAAAR
jgi:acyl-CoA thioesterase I